MDAPDRRIAAVSAHLAATAEPASAATEPQQSTGGDAGHAGAPDAGAPDAGAPEFTGVASDPARLIEEFAMRGMVVLGPGDIGVPMELHRTVFEKEKIAVQEGLGGFILSRVPEVVDVINSPGIVSACNQIVGEGWAIVPFCHHATFASGGRDQHWVRGCPAPPSPPRRSSD